MKVVVWGRGLHWVWANAMQISRERAVLPLLRAGVRKFCGRPAGNGGIWRVIEMESTHKVEKEIKAAVYLTKAKQGKSDIWKQF